MRLFSCIFGTYHSNSGHLAERNRVDALRKLRIWPEPGRCTACPRRHLRWTWSRAGADEGMAFFEAWRSKRYCGVWPGGTGNADLTCIWSCGFKEYHPDIKDGNINEVDQIKETLVHDGIICCTLRYRNIQKESLKRCLKKINIIFYELQKLWEKNQHKEKNTWFLEYL